jgi:hypothetical protein
MSVFGASGNPGGSGSSAGRWRFGDEKAFSNFKWQICTLSLVYCRELTAYLTLLR